MAVARVQSVSVTGSSSLTATNAAWSNNAAGNLLVLLVAQNTNASTVSSVADTAGNTWTYVRRQTASSNRTVELWYAKNCASGANTVTVTWSGVVTTQGHIWEISGASTSAPLDQSNSQTNSATTTHSGGGITTTIGDGMIFAATVCDGAFSVSVAPSGYTQRGLQSRYVAYEKATSSTESTSEAWTSAVNESTCTIVANFTADAPAAGGASHFMLLGVG